MELIDRPKLSDCPKAFRVHVARLMLINFWASWGESGEACDRSPEVPGSLDKLQGVCPGVSHATGAPGRGCQ
jgi:hypothetical protein